jgi:hypothetical protein
LTHIAAGAAVVHVGEHVGALTTAPNLPCVRASRRCAGLAGGDAPPRGGLPPPAGLLGQQYCPLGQPIGHRFGAASAREPIPGKRVATIPPKSAPPTSRSARLRERVPLASPLASSSKGRSLASGDISALLSSKGGTRGSPAPLINAPTLAPGDEFPMNSWPTSENPF